MTAPESQPSRQGDAAPETAPLNKEPPSSTSPENGSTCFIASQIGGASVINYSYTDFPSRLMAYDIYQFFRLLWALPYVVWPFTPAGSGYMAELAPTPGNLWCLAVHTVLVVLQLSFIIAGLPALVMLPVWTAAAAISLCLGVNHVICMSLNGRGIEYHSNPECAPALPEHAHEQWIFLNGVAVGKHWMQSNLDRLALTFKRPILGIHNKTNGVIFDVIECLIQRNFTYATKDVRRAYAIVKDKLYEPETTKVVFILHSQGCIEGGLVLDWLLQELPRDLLAKLEVYTFGNAANHFNNPHHAINEQKMEIQAAKHVRMDEKQSTAVSEAPVSNTNGNAKASRTPKLAIDTKVHNQAAVPSCAIGHIEHYAHSTDFVALWGVLHFVNTARGSHMVPRFLGRVFARSSPQGGHQFIQHYLDGMFTLERDPVTGKFLGCAEENEFMESDIEIGREGDESANVHEAFEQSWLASLAEEGKRQKRLRSPIHLTAEVEIQCSSPVLVREASHPRKIKVKDISRLWQYRNGRSPDETPRSVRPVSMP